MKITIVTEHFYPYTGGIAEHTFHLAQELGEKYRVMVLAPLYPTVKFVPLPQRPNFEVVRIGNAAFFPANGSFTAFTYSPGAIFKLRKIIREEKPDIIHIQGSVVPTVPLVAALSNINSIKIVTFHAQHGKSKGYTLFKPLMQKAIRNIQGGIAVSLAARLTIERHFKIPNLTIIPNGVNTKRFFPDGPRITKFDDGSFNILFVGRMEPRKGFHTLLHALRHLKNRNIRLIAIGTGPLMRRYKNMAKKYGINTVFVGKVSPKLLPAYYRTADVFVAPSTKGESFGIVLLEAMASSLPIIASSVEGYVETLEEGRYGIVFKKGDSKELYNTLLYAMENKESLKEMSRRALSHVNLNYSWEAIARKTEDYYKFIINMYANSEKGKVIVSV